MNLKRDIVIPAPAMAAAPSRAVRVALGIAGAAAFATLTALGASMEIPLQPVPITLQTLFVLLAGASLGARYGTLSQLMYVGAGAAGLPVFAGGASGAAILAGPTGGYLIAFMITPALIALLLKRSETLPWQIASFTAGKLLILTLGVIHLTLFYTHDIGRSLVVGALPFLPGAVFKIVAAVSIHRSSRALVRHYRARQQ